VDSNEFGQLERNLLARGWTRTAEGGWNAPGRCSVLGTLETNGPKPAKARPLDDRPEKHQGGKEGVAIRITCVALRRRLLDGHDAVAFSMKPLTDAIARSLRMDDADPRLSWEYSQLRTDGEQGVMVKIETRSIADGKT
jgi:hypothetical protein